MTSATVSVWKDCGYTEGAYIVPSQSDTLPSPDFTFTLPSIPRDTLFSSFNVKHPYTDLYDCSYLRISYDFNNGSDIILYGWIDNVGCLSDTADSPNTTVKWHVDLWRTYLSRASFGAGTVMRRLPNNDDPPQSYPFKTSLVQDIKTDLAPSSNQYIYWAFMNVIQGESTKSTSTYCWPVNSNAPNFRYQLKDTDGSDRGQAPSFNQTVTGEFDELFGVDPTAIYGIWLSPVSPCDYTVESTSLSTYITMSPWRAFKNNTTGFFKPFLYEYTSVGSTDYYPTRTVAINEMTSDTSKSVITDMDGGPVLTLPWGVRVMHAEYRVVNADVGMYLTYRFVTRDSEYLDAAANGLECTIPLKTLPMSENARSSYVYGGQQDYDRTQLQIAREQALYSGLANIATGGLQGAVAGGTAQTTTTLSTNPGSESEKIQWQKDQIRKSGAGYGAIIGMAGQAAGAIGDYYITGITNDRTMDNTLDYMAQKTAAMTLPSSGIDWIVHGRRPMIVRLRWDQYSIDQRENDLLMYGARVHETHDNCQSIIEAGGPLQINNLNVTGSIPVQAKNYFRRRFSDGVKIV